jgi:hypothetical protein
MDFWKKFCSYFSQKRKETNKNDQNEMRKSEKQNSSLIFVAFFVSVFVSRFSKSFLFSCVFGFKKIICS